MKILPLLFLPIAAFGEETPLARALPVSPQDIVSTRTVHDGQRRITFQKLDAEAMAEKERQLQPPPSAPALPSPSWPPAAVSAKPIRFVQLGASVLIADPSRPEDAVTFLQLWPSDGGKPIASLWVNANFLWLTRAASHLETPEATYSFFLMATPGVEKIPAGLSFPADGKSHLVIAEGNPTEEQLAPIDQLLAIYDREKAVLRAQYDNRHAEAAEAERQRALNPPEHKDITIRYWVKPSSDSNPGTEGGAR